MANAVWKRIEKSPGYGRAKLFCKRVTGRELWLRPELGVLAAECADWWFAPGEIHRDSVAYSLGVGDDVSLDLALIQRFGISVHAFDPTPASADWVDSSDLPAQFHFHPWAVTAADGSITLFPRMRRDGSRSKVMYSMLAGENRADEGIEVAAFTIPTLMDRLGHSRIDLLKMDIEGAEYEVLDNLLDSKCRPQQILVEFHHRFSGIGPARTADTLRRLHEADYRIFAVSDTGREVSLLHTAERG